LPYNKAVIKDKLNKIIIASKAAIKLAIIPLDTRPPKPTLVHFCVLEKTPFKNLQKKYLSFL
jgi:hypothetical protein